MTSESFSLSVCSARIVRARMRLRPELIIVANWREKIASSFELDLVPEARDLDLALQRAPRTCSIDTGA